MVESNTTKALRGMSSQAIVTIALGVLEIASFSIMSRLLSQEDFGYYAVISAITTVFASFSESGIGSALIQRKVVTERFIDNSFTMGLILGTMLMILLILLSYPLSILLSDSSLTIPLILMSITLLCNCLTSVNTSIMYRRLEFLRVGSINLISLVITTIVAIVFAIHGYGYYAILSKAVLTSVLSFVMSYFMLKTKFHLRIDKDIVDSIWSYSGWLMISVLFRNLAQQIDRLLMSNLLSVSSLGMYNRPKEFINQISSKIGSIFDTTLFPVLSQVQDNFDSIRSAYRRSIYFLNVGSLVITMAFVVNSQLIIRIFFGTQWMNILPTFQILSITILFGFNARLADCYLRSLALTKQQFLFRVLDVILKLVGLLIGYKFGIVGVATSVLLTEFIMVVIKYIYIANAIKIHLIECVRSFCDSMRLLMFLTPILLVFNYCFPNTWSGNIIQLLVFVVIIIISFTLLPSIVGRQYKNEVYPKVIALLRRLFTYLIKFRIQS